MSVDPSTLIVAAVAAAGAFIQGTAAPPEIKDQATQTLESYSPATADQQVSDLISALPEPVRAPTQQAVDDIAAAAAAALEPHLPPGALTPPAPAPEPAAPAEPVMETPVPDPAPPALMFLSSPPSPEGDSIGDGAVLQPVPAAFPRASLAPVGAIALFAPWLRKAGAICDGIKPATLAALYAAENGFRYGPTAPVSPAGALGPGQFMPGTWAIYGKDADEDGKADVLGIADPVMASGNLLCDTYEQIDAWKRQGRVSGDTLDLTIAAYNAGSGAVLRSGGMPSGSPDYENQTKPYVAKIRGSELSFAQLLAPLIGIPLGDGVGGRVVESAVRYLGLPYVWGGGNVNGPSGGGFDCSGLTSFAVHAAAGIALPRTSETQWNVGQEIPMDQARPGDLLFGNWQSGGPGHVAIYIGNGQMIHAPTTGDVVRIADVFPEMKARRIF
ncbi:MULTISPECIES: NlpC/P60 family protein [Rhodococcus]|uniref:NlpC/P60 family protein n=1 Tax=Rhodococcus oxybenzonivorans TaxID=1990687 RepID=A0AAE4UWX0_9NOCA|nr:MULTISPECIES: NlpC/P60 family protein [Rhodococcus]MDV7243657.1 NlpC/P60 family protein [Rhodococcus oxybenzonivorans]MDV7264280.1 NlpC/P60 family protein [Rhodococcus oxybenzonivorans]MDV7275101.1 NlpC/P60 family protein [Rhodococcus oxybenzonivorans]MDV7335339.1 NlpC/P60 family protein [Rhodococcus oxybenzonivorans]MDV7346050.1 NlpC/P60 family protein [Rhodococcus oxybenzonivorans]